MKVSLKAARINVNLTQNQAAEKLKVSKDTIVNWEKGRSFPDAIKIKEIESVYKVTYEDIDFLPNSTFKK